MCIKCADLSHALIDWKQHLDWSLRVAEEFYQQVKDSEEKSTVVYAAIGEAVACLCNPLISRQILLLRSNLKNDFVSIAVCLLGR